MTSLRVAVLGVGLIGGSIALSARRRLGAHVSGWDPDAGALERAVQMGAIDTAAGALPEAVAGADYAFVAAPVGACADVALQALEAASAECVVSDAGSTKRRVAAAVSDPRFVPGHPLAGAETAGVDGAREDLFDGALWYFTPADDRSAPALARLSALVQQLGATPVALDPDAHDRLMAAVSQLPHVFANVLVAQALRAAPTAGGSLGDNPSFRDATRVAGANTGVWTDIYVSNADMLAATLDDTISELSGIRDALDAEDAAALSAWNERARENREST